MLTITISGEEQKEVVFVTTRTGMFARRAEKNPSSIKPSHDNSRMPRPTRDQTILAITSTAKCTHKEATRFLDWMVDIVRKSRLEWDHSVLPSDVSLRRFHRILVAVIPDQTASVPGSTHEMLEKFLLNPAKGEYGIRHDMQASGGICHCLVEVTVSSSD